MRIFNFQFLISNVRKIVERIPAVSNRITPYTIYHIPYTQRGYSLVEVLVAITVLLIALVGPLTIAHTGLQRSMQSKDNTMAVFLAQEGIEAIVKLREDGALSVSEYSDSSLWDSLTDLASLCPAGNDNRCGARLGDDGSIVSVYRCSSNCDMRFYVDSPVPYKQGAPSGDATPYTRELTISVDGEVAHIRSEVFWGDEASESIMLESYVYNIYYEE